MTRQTLQTNLPTASGFAAIALTSTNALRALDDMGALAQSHAEPLFDAGEPPAEGGPRDAELPRCTRQRLGLHGARESEDLSGLQRFGHLIQKVAADA